MHAVRLLAIVLATVGTLTLGNAVADAAPASGNVWIIVNQGNCGNNNKIIGIGGGSEYTAIPGGWDKGDNVVYPRVQFNKDNHFALQLMCADKNNRLTGYRTVIRTIRPQSTGQKFWF